MTGRKRKNTLFNKVIFLFTITSFVSFVFAGILLSRFMVSYSVSDSVSQMRQAANLISGAIEIYKTDDEQVDTYVVTGMTKYVQNYYELTGSYVYIVDTDGRVVISAPGIEESNIKDNLNNELGYYYLKNKNQYETAINSENIIVDKGDFYGLYDGTNTGWVTIARRLETTDENNELLVYGVIIISRPDLNVYISRTTVIKYFLLSMSGALLLALLLTTFFTRRITEPIENLKMAANAVSKGDFYGKIEYDSDDDMGDLINSFNTMTKSLASLDKTKNDFIANVSHELRTPITTIRGFIEGMLDGTIPEEKRDYYLAIVRDEVVRMNKLVNDQLQLARMQQGTVKLKQTSFDINEMIRMEIIKNEKNIEAKNIEIVVDFENEKQNVFAEEESINRVIINLLNNAIKFTPEGGTITLGTLKKKGMAEIFIRDTGVGVAPEDRENVFERYFKSDRSRGMDKNGTGLGLSICKSIVNAHNHDIKVRDNPEGQGAEFVFWLDAI